MATAMAKILTQDGKITSKAERNGIEVIICDPLWFAEKSKFKINSLSTRVSELEFTGADLNYMARVLYAESSGSGQLLDANARSQEKEAILNVKYFRLNRAEYPNRSYIAKSFREVCDAPGQFESVLNGTPKYKNSDVDLFQALNSAECKDLGEAIAAVKKFLDSGPNEDYQYDNFRGYNPTGRGDHIGRSRFWLSERGKQLLRKTA